MPTTYEPIATSTLGSAAASITFSSIPATYTDLRVVLTATVSAGQVAWMRFNSDSGVSYSETYLEGSGTAASSGTNSPATKIQIGTSTYLSTTIPSLLTADIFSYAGSTYKTCLTSQNSDFNGSGYVNRLVGLWLSTSAITSITLLLGSTANYAAGTTATLYGIKNA
jgi:hypothetical protein